MAKCTGKYFSYDLLNLILKPVLAHAYMFIGFGLMLIYKMDVAQHVKFQYIQIFYLSSIKI